MAWVAVDEDGSEYIYDDKPERANGYWDRQEDKEGYPIGGVVLLPNGAIKKLIGRELTWNDESVEI